MSNCSAAFSSTWRKWLERAIGSHRTRDLPVPLLKFNNVLDNYEEQPWGALENLTNVRTEEEGRERTMRQLLWLCSREKRMLVKILSVCASKNRAEFMSSIKIDKFQFILVFLQVTLTGTYLTDLPKCCADFHSYHHPGYLYLCHSPIPMIQLKSFYCQ